MTETVHRGANPPQPRSVERPVDRLSVAILTPTAAATAAVSAALASARIGPEVAHVCDEHDTPARGPVLVVAESMRQLDPELLFRANRDFLLLAEVPDQLATRVHILRERVTRRRSELRNAEDLRHQAMALVSAVHAASSIDELAAGAADGLRRLFSKHAVAVVIPADPSTENGSAAVCRVSPGGTSATPAVLADYLADFLHDRDAVQDSAPDGSSVVELSDADGSGVLAAVFGARTGRGILVPIAFEGGANGAVLTVDTATSRCTTYERELLSFVGRQISRAVSELWLRQRQERAQSELQTTSSELRRLLNEMDDLGTVVRSIADAVNVGVLFYDTDNKPTLHNRMLEHLLSLTGFDPETGLSTHVYASDRRTRVKQDKNIISETLEGDERGLIYWLGDPRGEQRAVVTEAHAIVRPNGDSLGSAIVTYDVTDLANAIEIREEYLATVSHELRTPLTSIVGYLDLIDDGYDVESLGFGKEFRTIQHSAEQMLALIRDLLSTSTNDLALRIEPVDISTLLTQSVASLQPTLEAENQTLSLELPAARVLAHLDGGRIKQVVDNLITNASKYTQRGGAIVVRLEGGDESIVITVRDNGRGISKSDQARLFDRFFRTREVREAAIQGVGIGLTIVRTIVEAHGGTITVDSELGKGSVFTVRLPLRAEATPLTTLPMRP